MIILYNLLRLMELLLLIRIVLSWIHKEQVHAVTIWICKIVDVVLDPLRKIIPLTPAGIDFSPVILFILIDLIKRALFSTFF